MKWLLFTALWFYAGGLGAEPGADPGAGKDRVIVADPERARVHYMLHCQGCHLPDAAGSPGHVPGMKDFVGNFLHSPEGRAYLIRVPGVATAQLADADVAELMNWLLTTYSAAQLPANFEPFTAEEVAGLRKEPDGNPAASRERILDDLAAILTSVARQNALPASR